MKIELVIDELVLHGFDATARHTIGDAVASELTRLVRAHASDLQGQRSRELSELDAGSFGGAIDIPANAGAGIANSVFGALKGHAS